MTSEELLTTGIIKQRCPTTHERFRDNLDVLLDCQLDSEQIDTLCTFLSYTVKRAFQRGLVAGRGLHDEADSVDQAQKAGITDMDTLSNLYVRELGFQE